MKNFILGVLLASIFFIVDDFMSNNSSPENFCEDCWQEIDDTEINPVTNELYNEYCEVCNTGLEWYEDYYEENQEYR